MAQHIRLTQLDGKLPNLALMRLAAWHEDRGDVVCFHRSPHRQLFEPNYTAVYGSAIFRATGAQVERLRMSFPDALIGGTGTDSPLTVESVVGVGYERVSYAPWPEFTGSLGFTQRGCRFKCGFCVVPKKEGAARPVATVADIWRGDPWPRHLHLLDNDFFGQPKADWKARLAEVRGGRFAVCFNQGINVRVVTDEIASELASVTYRDNGFREPRIYTAWDSLGDEGLFFRGVDRLERAGVPPRHLMAYMLIGYDPSETWATVFHRFNRMVERGIKPFPMIYAPNPGDRQRKLPLGGYNRTVGHLTLANFQRWVNGFLYRKGVAFEDYDAGARHDPHFKSQDSLDLVAA